MCVVSSVAGVLVALALSVGGWAWLGRPVAMPDVPGGRFQCLSYEPSSADGSPLTARDDGAYTVPPALIARDVALLARYTDCLRIYSATAGHAEVLPAAAAQGMQVLLGLWIGIDPARNAEEIERALALAAAHPAAVRALVVGNEVLLRREMSGERLAGIIRAVKARTALPVAYADMLEFWRRNPAVVEAVDLMLLHVLPYWFDPVLPHFENGREDVLDTVARARAAFPGKPLMIGEIGWPSAGRSRGAARPSPLNQARFLRTLAADAERLGVPYNLIEAIDQPWKRNPEGTVGGYWGLLDAGRAPKFPLTGPVSAHPRWRPAALATAAFAVLALGWAYATGAPPGLWRALALGLAGSAVGAVLWALLAQLATMARNLPTLAWAAFLFGLALGGGLLLLQLIRGGPSRWLVRPAPLRRLLAPPPRTNPPNAAGDGPARLPGAFQGTVLLGAFQGAVLLSGAAVALLMAADGRYRDFLTLAYALPAAALAWLALRVGPPPGDCPEEGWAAAVLLVSAPLAIDDLGNAEAIAWAACCAVLALPWLRFAGREALRNVAALLPPRQRQPGRHQRHG